MTQSSKKPVAVAIGTALAGGLLLSGASFAVTPLAQGYLLGAQDAATADAKAKEGSCGGDKARAEGKCGEGRCGMERADTDKDGRISKAEFDAMQRDRNEIFARIDADGDGFISQAEHDAHRAAAKSDMEGKCGEGKCGGMA